MPISLAPPYTHRHTHMHTCKYVCTHAHACISTHGHADTSDIHRDTYTICAHIHTHVHACVHTDIHAYTDTSTSAHTRCYFFASIIEILYLKAALMNS